MSLEIIDILGEVCKQSTFVLQKANKRMGGRKLVGRRQNIFSDVVKYAGVVSKQADVKNLLWVAEPEMLKLRVQTCALRTEVGYAETCGYLPFLSVAGTQHI